MEVWNTFVSFLNYYGGLIGAVSLVLSIIIYVTTGNIKRDMIQSRQIKEYRSGKRASVNHLKEIVVSMEMDQLYDNAIKVELLAEINKLLKYKVFLDVHCKYYIFQINRILNSNSINEKNASRIVSYVAKLCGRMSVDPVNREVR